MTVAHSRSATDLTRRRTPVLAGGLFGGAFALLLALPLLGQSAADGEAWGHVRALRDVLPSGADETQLVDFVQTFVPAGFSTGDLESGRMAISRSCLRWDYDVPYEKSFLVCDDRAYLWNAGESEGRRFAVDAQNEPGLDLIRLQVDELTSRYDAAVTQRDDDFVEIKLTPRADIDHPARDALLTLDPHSNQLTSVTYSDAEGNTTRFELTGHRRGEAGAFEPPGLVWLDE